MNPNLLAAAASMTIVLAPASVGHRQAQWQAPQPARAATVVPRVVVPRPGRFITDDYADYVVSPRELLITRDTLGFICPAHTQSPTCDPYTAGYYRVGQRLSAGGYVVRGGIRWWWVDEGINIWGSHGYAWIDARDVSG